MSLSIIKTIFIFSPQNKLIKYGHIILHLQQAAVTEVELDNQSKEQQITIDNEKWHQEKEKIEQAIAVINGITDPIEKAKLYKKVFTDCCDVPQSGGCGCNDHTEA